MAACSGVFNVSVPPGVALPYIVFSVAASVSDNTFRTDVVEHIIRLSVITSARSGLSTPATLLKRLYGDATTLTSRTPSYGLHRHILSVPAASEPTEWVGSLITHVDSTQEHTQEVYHFIETYKVITSRSSP
ncbi:MAG: hypothetical protein KF678_03490 [Phycisphaeraceae bacterium]|nr:hypothetical protein [Phycisphaeraceae bacterium]